MAESISTAYTFSPKQPPRRNTLPVTQEQPKIKHTQKRFFYNVAVLPSYCQKIIAELLGTYILIFAGCGSALVDRDRSLTILGIAMVWGLCLMALIYSLGHISGAHFNPAVSIAFAASGRLPLLYVPMYVVSQILGSALACLTLKILFDHQKDTLPTVTRYSTPTTDAEAFLWEFVITFILMFSINGAATDDRSSKELAGVAIGVTLMFNVIIAGPITGASMNPARSIGPAVVANEYENLWIFIVAPILGALTASLVYSLLRQPKQEKQDFENEDPRSIYNDLFSQSIP
ncbi:nodulin-26-like [Cynara cardunculus var. scolymus]|uniref:nodulin-26-like n=1 Tax=Cynara cardunculus var. scolymus TaxID=59895 RepID=UPI000D6278A8|nr:nodulin-26-like [Cynara cardunculus var. scolymus]